MAMVSCYPPIQTQLGTLYTGAGLLAAASVISTLQHCSFFCYNLQEWDPLFTAQELDGRALVALVQVCPQPDALQAILGTVRQVLTSIAVCSSLHY
jgi:hypothetical protein